MKNTLSIQLIVVPKYIDGGATGTQLRGGMNGEAMGLVEGQTEVVI